MLIYIGNFPFCFQLDVEVLSNILLNESENGAQFLPYLKGLLPKPNVQSFSLHTSQVTASKLEQTESNSC